MPHLFLHVGGALALLQEQASESVPQVVKANATQACLGEQPVKHSMPQVVAVERPAVLVRENPLWYVRPAFAEGFCLPLREQGFERLCELRRHVHTPSLAALGCRDTPSYEVAPNLDEPPIKVNVAPLEAE